jgi:hypothetical protein
MLLALAVMSGQSPAVDLAACSEDTGTPPSPYLTRQSQVAVPTDSVEPMTRDRRVIPAAADDPRIVTAIDPRKALECYPESRFSLQAGRDLDGRNVERDIIAFPEPGYRDPNTGEFTVQRTTDPADVAKSAFRHKILQGMSYRQGKGYQSARASIMSRWSAASPFVLRDGTPYWAAFAIYIDKDHPFDGSGDHIGIMSFGHSVSSSNTQSMNKLDLRKDGKLRFWVRSNRVLDGTNASTEGTVHDFPIEKGVWNYLVFQWKYEWDAGKGPYTRLWLAVGGAAPVQLLNTSIANAFHESAGYHPWKFGLYMWDVNKGWGSSPSRTIYTKGLYIFKDEPGTPTLDPTTLVALLRSM